MKKAFVLVLVLVFCSIGLVATVFAQGLADRPDQSAIAKAKAGNFTKAEVVKTDPAAKTITAKGPKGTYTADVTYASYNGAFNAAQDLKPGDKIAGHWVQISGKNFITFIVKVN